MGPLAGFLIKPLSLNCFVGSGLWVADRHEGPINPDVCTSPHVAQKLLQRSHQRVTLKASKAVNARQAAKF